MRRTKEDAAKTRDTLIKFGLEVFRKKGYAATRLEDIAREAQVTRGAIYWHFGNKLELYRALVDESITQIGTLLSEISVIELTPLAKIRQFMLTFFKKLDEENIFSYVEDLALTKSELTAELEPINRKFNTLFHQVFELIQNLVEGGIKTGEIRATVNPQDVTWAIFIFFRGAMSFSADRREHFSSSQKADALTDLFITGISRF